MFVKELKTLLDQVDDATEIEIVSGFDLLTLSAVFTQAELLDYLVRPGQMTPLALTPDQRRQYVKQNAKVVELVENTALWGNSLFLVALPPSTLNEQP